MRKSPHCTEDWHTHYRVVGATRQTSDSLDSVSTFKRSWINNLILYPSEHHQAEGKWFSLLCSLNFLIKETSLILVLKLTELDFSKENCRWFLKRWPLYTFFSLLGFICLWQLQFWSISSCAQAISWLSPTLSEVYGAKWSHGHFLNEK